MHKCMVVIPCRAGSTRLVNKALYPILGKPSIGYPIKAAAESGLPFFLATDIPELLEGYSYARAEPGPHRNGTEGAASVVIEGEAEGYVIVAGDETTVTPGQIRKLAEAGGRSNVICTLTTSNKPPTAVTTCDVGGGTLCDRYPLYRGLAGQFVATGLYYYPADMLAQYLEAGPSPREVETGIELMRAIDNHWYINAFLDNSHSGLGLNTIEDVPLIEAWLTQSQQTQSQTPTQQA